MNNHFTIAIDTCNHEGWIERCINTCVTQDYENFDVILVDAISDDKTFEIAQRCADTFDNLEVFQNEVRIPQVANFVWLNKQAKPGTIVVSIDGDDWFKNKKVLKKLNDVYNSGEVWMTYGTYEEFPYRNVSHVYQPYPQDIIDRNAFREYRWMASHLRTWRKELFEKIDEADLKRDDGEWLDTTGDQAIMFPMLEMSANKSRHISEVTYIWNASNMSRDGATNEKRQVELSNYVRAKKRYSPVNEL